MDNAERVGALIRQGPGRGAGRRKGVVDIRGHGLMIGIELDRPCGVLVGKALAEKRVAAQRHVRSRDSPAAGADLQRK
jgi:4-aminobutyrate aminotransferase-like enzyme